jgi:hypothetical protein
VNRGQGRESAHPRRACTGDPVRTRTRSLGTRAARRALRSWCAERSGLNGPVVSSSATTIATVRKTNVGIAPPSRQVVNAFSGLPEVTPAALCWVSLSPKVYESMAATSGGRVLVFEADVHRQSAPTGPRFQDSP